MDRNLGQEFGCEINVLYGDAHGDVYSLYFLYLTIKNKN